MRINQISLYLQTLLLIVFRQCSCQWIEIASGYNTYPAHIYRVYLQKGDKLKGILRWDNSNTDLDILVYYDQYSYYGSPRISFTNHAANETTQLFQFESNYSTNYYIRVYGRFLSELYTNYTLQFNVSKTTQAQYTYNGVFYKLYPNSHIVIVENLTIGQSVPMKYESTRSLKAIIKNNVNENTYYTSPYLNMCMPVQSLSNYTWILIFGYFDSYYCGRNRIIYSDYSFLINKLRYYSYRVYYNDNTTQCNRCPPGSVYYNNTCQLSRSINSIGSINSTNSTNSINSNCSINSTNSNYSTNSINSNYSTNSINSSYSTNSTNSSESSYSVNSSRSRNSTNSTESFNSINSISSYSSINSSYSQYSINSTHSQRSINSIYSTNSTNSTNCLNSTNSFSSINSSKCDYSIGSNSSQNSINSSKSYMSISSKNCTYCINSTNSDYQINNMLWSFSNLNLSQQRQLDPAKLLNFTSFGQIFGSHSSYSIFSTSSSYSINSTNSIFSINSIISEFCINSTKSIFSINSTDSINSINSNNSIDSINSINSENSTNSFNCIDSKDSQYSIDSSKSNSSIGSENCSFCINSVNSEYQINNGFWSFPNSEQSSLNYLDPAGLVYFTYLPTFYFWRFYFVDSINSRYSKGSINSSYSVYSINSIHSVYSINSTNSTFSINSINSTFSINSTNSSYSINSTNSTYSINSTNSSHSINSINSTFAINSTNFYNVTSSNRIIVPVAVSVSCVGVVGVVIFFCMYRRCKRRKQKYDQYQIQPSKRQFDVMEEQPCAVCLDRNCDAVLHCKHMFHEACIREWHIRNQRCPLCREMFWKEDIRVLK